MIVELNIGLDVGGGDNSREARILRANEACRLLGDDAPAVVATIGDMGGAEEPCLYARAYFSHLIDLTDVGWKLCDALGQDCIAAAFSGSGALIGPKAAEWGDFNPEYFRRPALAVAA